MNRTVVCYHRRSKERTPYEKLMHVAALGSAERWGLVLGPVLAVPSGTLRASAVRTAEQMAEQTAE
ncbi:MAG: hypothetical protein ABSG90_14695 [Dehalococcoidia bacterium]